MGLGLKAALARNPDFVVSLDADGQVDLAELPRFVATALDRGADAVISSRFLGKECFDYPYPLVNWIGNRILVGILRLATGHKFTDSHGGLRVMRARALRGLRLIGRHTYVQETLIQMERAGFRIVELPSRWRPRLHGDSRVLHSIFRYVVRTLPSLLYYLGAHLLGLAAAVWFLLDAAFFGFVSAPTAIAAVFLAAIASVWLMARARLALRIGDS